MNEQQAEELAALEIIYPECLEKHMDSCFDIYISLEMSQSSNDGIRLSVLFPESYPDEAPIISFKTFGNTTETDIEHSKALVEDIINRSIGSPMLFDIVSSIREYLEVLAAPKVEKPMEIYKKTYETYTQVSLESFLQWKKRFDDEILEAETLRKETCKNELYINGLTYSEVWTKPSGRELFEKGNDIEEIKEEEDIEVV